MGDIIGKNVAKNYPEEVKQIEIAKKDERNMMIANRVKSKAYDATIYI